MLIYQTFRARYEAIEVLRQRHSEQYEEAVQRECDKMHEDGAVPCVEQTMTTRREALRRRSRAPQ